MAEELRQSLEKLGAAADITPRPRGSDGRIAQVARSGPKGRRGDGAQEAQATSPRDDHYRVPRAGRRTWN